ncbi:MAG: cytochrome c3 family protein [Deltaproteobacteria bacterium]|nr:cytochrome c3 family protein [Deltaproteobacteria bacterium]
MAAPPAVAPFRKNSCLECHSELERSELKAPVLAMTKDVHGTAGVSCVNCHGGNPTAVSARVAHGAKFVARPGATAAVTICGSCHAQPLWHYQKGNHSLARKLPRQPSCVTCHGAHGVAKASIELISEPLCSSCHPVEQARRIYKAVKDVEVQVAQVDEVLRKQGNPDDFRTKLLSARSTLRALSHTLNLFEITRKTAEVISVADEIQSKVTARAGKISWAKFFKWVLIALGFVLAIGFTAIAVIFIYRKRFYEYLFRIPRIFLISGGILAVIGLLIAWRTHHYIQHDPRFCTSCHTMQSAYQRWAESGHKDIECHTCHESYIMSNLHQLWVYTTRRPDEVVKHAFVDHTVCEQCHASGGNQAKWNKVLQTPGHQIHVGKERVQCIQCHSLSVHRFKPGTDLCHDCHKQVTLKAAGSMAEMHCMECHPFLAKDAKRSLKPDRTACLECHATMHVAGEEFPEEAPMQWACGECHKPHEKLRITNAECSACHEDAVKNAFHRQKAGTQCIECHKPHSWKATGPGEKK